MNTSRELRRGALNGTGQEHAPRPIELSIVTTAANEAGNVNRLLEECLAAVESLGIEAEFLFIDDASTDRTAEAVQRFADQNDRAAIPLIRHPTPPPL